MGLRNAFNTSRALFEGPEETRILLHETATLFFHDLSGWLVDSIFVGVARLTEPAKGFLRRENLSSYRIIERLEGCGMASDAIHAHHQKLLKYREITKPARDKFVSHLDLESVRNGEVLGKHRSEDADHFFEALQAFCDEAATAVGLPPLDFGTQAGSGDVLDLIKVLKRAQKGTTKR